MSNDELRALYRKTAPFYDAILAAYHLLGVKHHRRATVAALALEMIPTYDNVIETVSCTLPAEAGSRYSA